MAGKRLGSLVMDLVANTSKFRDGLNDATRKTKKFQSSQKSMTKAISANWKLIGTAIAGVVSFQTVRGLKNLANGLDSIAKSSKGLGASSAGFGGLQFAAGFAGVEIEKLRESLSKLNIVVGDAVAGNNTRAIDAFNELGISLALLSSLDTSEQFKLIGDAIRNVDNATKQAALGSDIFDESFSKILPLLETGSESMTLFQKEAKKLGLAFTEQELKGVENLNDELKLTGDILRGIVLKQIVALAPALTDILRLINADLKEFNISISTSGLQQFEKFGNWLVVNEDLITNSVTQLVSSIGALTTLPILIAAGVQQLGAFLATILSGVSQLVTWFQRALGFGFEYIVKIFTKLENILQEIFYNIQLYITKGINNVIAALSEIPVIGEKIGTLKLDLPDKPIPVDTSNIERFLGQGLFADETQALADSLAESATTFFRAAIKITKDNKILDSLDAGLMVELNISDAIKSIGNYLSNVNQPKPVIDLGKYAEAGKPAFTYKKPEIQLTGNFNKDVAATVNQYKIPTTYKSPSIDEKLATEELRLKLAQVNEQRNESIDIIRRQIALLEKQKAKQIQGTDEYLQTQISIAEKTKEIISIQEDMGNQLSKLQEVAVDFGNALEDALVDAAANGKFAFGDLADYVVAQINRMILNAMVIEPLFGKTGVITSALGGVSSGIGSAIGSIFAGGRALGGPVLSGHSYMVGEQGPEMFVPAVAGNIVPNENMGNSFYVDARGASVEAVARLEQVVNRLNGSIEYRTLAAVQNEVSRNPSFLRR